MTAAALIYSSRGKRSGAFMNPAMVLCFVRLGKLSLAGAAGYVAAQLVGSVAGVLLASVELRRLRARRTPRPCGKLTHDETVPCFVGCDCAKGSAHG